MPYQWKKSAEIQFMDHTIICKICFLKAGQCCANLKTSFCISVTWPDAVFEIQSFLHQSKNAFKIDFFQTWNWFFSNTLMKLTFTSAKYFLLILPLKHYFWFCQTWMANFTTSFICILFTNKWKCIHYWHCKYK